MNRGAPPLQTLNMPPTTDLATLLSQLYQHAQIMENIINGVHIPSNINQAGLAHCKEYLGRALDHMIKMGDAYRAISKQHPEDLHTPDVQAASARQDQLLARFDTLITTLRGRTPNQLKNTLATNQVGDTNAFPPVRIHTLNPTWAWTHLL